MVYLFFISFIYFICMSLDLCVYRRTRCLRVQSTRVGERTISREALARLVIYIRWLLHQDIVWLYSSPSLSLFSPLYASSFQLWGCRWISFLFSFSLCSYPFPSSSVVPSRSAPAWWWFGFSHSPPLSLHRLYILLCIIERPIVYIHTLHKHLWSLLYKHIQKKSIKPTQTH